MGCADVGAQTRPSHFSKQSIWSFGDLSSQQAGKFVRRLGKELPPSRFFRPLAPSLRERVEGGMQKNIGRFFLEFLRVLI